MSIYLTDGNKLDFYHHTHSYLINDNIMFYGIDSNILFNCYSHEVLFLNNFFNQANLALVRIPHLQCLV